MYFPQNSKEISFPTHGLDKFKPLLVHESTFWSQTGCSNIRWRTLLPADTISRSIRNVHILLDSGKRLGGQVESWHGSWCQILIKFSQTLQFNQDCPLEWPLRKKKFQKKFLPPKNIIFSPNEWWSRKEIFWKYCI